MGEKIKKQFNIYSHVNEKKKTWMNKGGQLEQENIPKGTINGRKSQKKSE